MRKRTLVLAFAVAFTAALASAPLVAQESAKKMEMPQKPAELSQLAIFGGTWNCTGTAFASPMGPEHKTSATVKGAMAVGGWWMHVSYDEKEGGPMTIHSGIYMGYDPAKKQFVLGCVDNMGTYCTQTSSGWNGDTMVFEGVANSGGQKMPIRDTFTKKGPTQMTHLGEMQGEGGKWMKMDEESCHKGK